MTFSEIENNKVCYTYTDLSKQWEFYENKGLKLNYLTRELEKKWLNPKSNRFQNLYSKPTKIWAIYTHREQKFSMEHPKIFISCHLHTVVHTETNTFQRIFLINLGHPAPIIPFVALSRSLCKFRLHNSFAILPAMLPRDIGDGMCWSQLLDD